MPANSVSSIHLRIQRALASKVRDLFVSTQAAESELAELAAEHARKLERLDLLSFQHDEIQKADPKPRRDRTGPRAFGCSLQRRQTP